MAYVLSRAEKTGNLCLEKHESCTRSGSFLENGGFLFPRLRERAAELVKNRQLFSFHKWVYLWRTGCVEGALARAVAEKLLHQGPAQPSFWREELLQVEAELGMTLNDQQRKAVLTAVSSPLTILTGGPGTGKTMTQKALVSLYHRVYPGKTVACCAPTGRAARRMEESTGVKAATSTKP